MLGSSFEMIFLKIISYFFETYPTVQILLQKKIPTSEQRLNDAKMTIKWSQNDS